MNVIGAALEGIDRDLRFGMRALIKSPGFTAMAVATLALGTGPNTAIFSLLSAVLLRPLPIEQPDRLVALNNASPRRTFPMFSNPTYEDLRDRGAVFSDLIAYRFVPVSLRRGDVDERLWGYLVTGNYFEALGVRPALGRLLAPADDQSRGGSPVVVLAHASWRKRFGAASDIVGRSILVNGRSYTVIGVAAEGFQGSELVATSEMWFPLAMQAQVEVSREWLDDRGAERLFVQGRLRPGVSRPEAQATLETLARQLAEEHPETNGGRRITLTRAGLLGSFGTGPLTSFAGSLMLFASLVLLLACANLANLLLARGSDREGEIAIRLALGASRRRVVRQLLAESLVLAVAGSTLGFVLATWLTSLATRLRPPIEFPLVLELQMDHRVLAFSCLAAVATTLLFGLLPALQATKPDLLPALREGAGPGGLRRSWLRRGLVVSQVALSFVLLIGGGLMLRAAGRAQAVDLGFDPQGAVEISVDLRLQGYGEGQGRELQKQLLENVRGLPVVQAAGLADLVPVDLHFPQERVFVEGRPPLLPAEAPRAFTSRVSPGYLQAMGTRLLRGRDLGAHDDEDAPRVAIVNETFARVHWAGADPLGRRFRLGYPEAPALLVVGVARDGKYAQLAEEPKPFVFRPLLQSYSSAFTLVARGEGDSGRLLALVRGELARIDRRIPLASARTLGERLSVPLLPTRLAAAILGSLGLLALVLAAVGIYGVTSYAVSRRTREIGIRMALGAERSDVQWLVVGDGMRTTLAGIGIGSLAAVLLARLVERLLFGVSATDQPTYLGVAVLLASVAFVACYLPARRAAKNDPALTLRSE